MMPPNLQLVRRIRTRGDSSELQIGFSIDDIEETAFESDSLFDEAKDDFEDFEDDGH